ncbi:MAG: TrmH family RNA methyltransferase [Pyrinomonadaceae bacterium]
MANYPFVKITSRDNSLLRRARAVRDGDVDEALFVEGLRLCEEAFRSGLKIETVIYSERIVKKERAAKLISELERVAGKSATVREKLLASISCTKTPQGIVVLTSRPAITENEFKRRQPPNPLLMVLHDINNPVNAGAIIRTAEAAGATGVITTAGTADPFSPKSLRGAMGAAFRLPIWIAHDYSKVIDWCRKQRIQIVGADADGAQNYTEIDWRRPTALIMGSESEGLSVAEISAADHAVSIPMQGSTESLNVAVAAGILLYEASRQR